MTGIYKIANIKNNRVYIGQSNNLERRRKEHFDWNLKSSQYIDIIIKENKQDFIFEIIEICDSSLLDEREKYWISFYNSFYDGYNKTKGGQNQYCGHPKLTKEDVEHIRIAYNLHEEKESVYNLYADKISKAGFSHIWDGSRWKDIMPEVYTEENKAFHREKGRWKKGQNHPSSKLTDEEVLKIRNRYVNETCREIWEDYKDKYTLGSLKQILTGVKYSHLPIYKKTERKWINE